VKFKIGDTIQPIKEHLEKYKVFYTKFPLSGKVIGILGDDKKQFPVIKDAEGILFTVNPDLYEIVEPK
jgi:hypothetical protein